MDVNLLTLLEHSRVDYLGHVSTRQYARLVDDWVSAIGWIAANMATFVTPKGFGTLASISTMLSSSPDERRLKICRVLA
jgi:hypothetical protein